MKIEMTDEDIEKAAVAIARKMLDQNGMLEIIDDFWVYDEYDNRTYDCRALAVAAFSA